MSVMLYNPNGTAMRLKAPETVELPWGVMQRIIEFVDLMNLRSVGLHCSKCKQDFTAQNGDHDPVLKMRCGCREFWSVNAAQRS
jgi:hypothetical protein